LFCFAMNVPYLQVRRGKDHKYEKKKSRLAHNVNRALAPPTMQMSASNDGA